MKSLSTLLFCVFVLLFLDVDVRPQGKVTPTMVTIKHYDNEPLRIVGIRYGNQEVTDGDSFDAPDDWLRTFAVRVKNVSTRAIYFVMLDTDFTRDKGTHLLPPIHLVSGVMFN